MVSLSTVESVAKECDCCRRSHILLQDYDETAMKWHPMVQQTAVVRDVVQPFVFPIPMAPTCRC